MHIPSLLLSCSDDIAALSKQKKSMAFSTVYWLLIMLANLADGKPVQSRELEKDVYVLF